MQFHYQPLNGIVLKRDRNRKMHIHSSCRLHHSCRYRSCVVRIFDGLPAILENQENYSAGITFRGVKRVSDLLFSQPLHPFLFSENDQ